MRVHPFVPRTKLRVIQRECCGWLADPAWDRKERSKQRALLDIYRLVLSLTHCPYALFHLQALAYPPYSLPSYFPLYSSHHGCRHSGEFDVAEHPSSSLAWMLSVSGVAALLWSTRFVTSPLLSVVRCPLALSSSAHSLRITSRPSLPHTPQSPLTLPLSVPALLTPASRRRRRQDLPQGW